MIKPKEPSSQLSQRMYGINDFTVLHLMPTKETREKLGWNTANFKGYKDEARNNVRIEVVINRKEDDIVTGMSFWITNELVPTSTTGSGRSLYCDESANFKWLTEDELKNGTFIKPFKGKNKEDLFSFFPETARRAYQGEEEFSYFLKAWLRAPENCRIENIPALFTEDYSELQQLTNSNTVLVPLGVIEKEVQKEEGTVTELNYQAYTKAFCDSWGNPIASTWGQRNTWDKRITKMMNIIDADTYKKADFGDGGWRVFSKEDTTSPETPPNNSTGLPF